VKNINFINFLVLPLKFWNIFLPKFVDWRIPTIKILEEKVTPRTNKIIKRKSAYTLNIIIISLSYSSNRKI
jgi:hypothetical protein